MKKENLPFILFLVCAISMMILPRVLSNRVEYLEFKNGEIIQDTLIITNASQLNAELDELEQVFEEVQQSIILKNTVRK